MRILHINGMTPPALAVAIALKEKALFFDLREYDWRETPQALAAFAGRLEILNSLEGEFPILEDDAALLCDSHFVLEYLDDAYADPPLRPGDAYGQWRLQALARFLGERAAPAVATLGVAARFPRSQASRDIVETFQDAPALTLDRRNAWASALKAPPSDDELMESYRKLAMLLERLAGELRASGGPWLLGAQFTLSDVAAYALCRPFVSGALQTGEVTVPPEVRAWFDAVAARPAVRAASALREPAYLPGPEHARWG